MIGRARLDDQKRVEKAAATQALAVQGLFCYHLKYRDGREWANQTAYAVEHTTCRKIKINLGNGTMPRKKKFYLFASRQRKPHEKFITVILFALLVILLGLMGLAELSIRLNVSLRTLLIITGLGLFTLALTPVIFLVYRYIRRERRFRALKLSDVDRMDGFEFEQFVGRLLQNAGYAVHVTKASGDLGVDVTAEKSFIKYSVQVKRQVEPVSRRAISDAVAGKDHYHCNAAMVVTNAYFTPGAKDLAKSTNCALIDRDTLAEWILDYQKANPTVSKTS